jgi:butyrate kinase
MAFNIFVVNPGSTSTKVALFKEKTCIFEKTLQHAPEALGKFTKATSQLDFRLNSIYDIIRDEKADLSSCDAFAGRGGLLRPLKGGTYTVNESMLSDLNSSRYGDHASNLGAVIAYKLAEPYGRPAFVVNPVVVDEMIDEARFTGLPFIKRKSVFHALNQKAIASKTADAMGIPYNQANFIIAHLGGGISVGVHCKGNVIDVNDALEEGPFSPERAGSLPAAQLVDLCFSGRYKKEEIKKLLAGKGGLVAYTGTTDCRKLEEKASADESVRKLLDAMTYKISREICAGAASLYGKVDAVIITGGLARSEAIVESIRKRVSFLGEFKVYPGEDEMSALAEGVLKVLQGIEGALNY